MRPYMQVLRSPPARPLRYLSQHCPVARAPHLTTLFLTLLTTMPVPTAEITVPKTGRTIKVSTGLFINNEFVPSVDSKETIQCVFLHASA